MNLNRWISALVAVSLAAGVLATNHFAGITVSNSVGGTSSYTCRSQAQWNDLATSAKNSGFRSLRILGFDCDALNRASTAAAREGLTVFAGIFISGKVASSTASVNQDLESFRDAYHKYGPARYVALTIGNEVNDSPSAISAETSRARTFLRSAGVATPVSTVHTWVNIRSNPSLCGADFVGANAHAFFDGRVSPEGAGNFILKTVVPALKAACPGKKIFITESGWPSRGQGSGTSSASTAAERLAIINLNCAARDPGFSLYAFEYDDQNWKNNDNERSFGIFGKLSLNGDALAKC